MLHLASSLDDALNFRLYRSLASIASLSSAQAAMSTASVQSVAAAQSLTSIQSQLSASSVASVASVSATSAAAAASQSVISSVAFFRFASALGSNAPLPHRSRMLGLQTFTGHAGGYYAAPVFKVGSLYVVGGIDSFNNLADALVDSCSIQKTSCSNVAYASSIVNAGQCADQYTACINAASPVISCVPFLSLLSPLLISG